MTPKRTEDWFQITQPDGKKVIAAPSYIKKLLGWDLSSVHHRLHELEYKVDLLEAPGRQAEILKLLVEHGRHTKGWIETRVSNFRGDDMVQLLEAGLIVTSKAGNVIMYSCLVRSE